MKKHVYNFKVLTEDECKKLKRIFKSQLYYTYNDLCKISKKHNIPYYKIIEFLEIKKKQERSMWDDFFSNAEETIKRIELNNDYAMINYKRIKNEFNNEINSNLNLRDIFYQEKI
ncbi:hypothetical protein H312_03495 [Anncaliia algerae PRA339]|uniref:Uncharacterized protein n=1 Tax=Anncaliia algerae PRA339 TaxID=1288291 RepID=A0A059EW91_9MICR|nr:hypothetical protein H312_03495 [Anncaliia algerae PRA339]